MKPAATLMLTTIFLFLALLSCTVLRPRTSFHDTGPVWFPAKIVRISQEYANINTDITEPQLAEHGITHGTKFNVKFENHTMQAFLGKTYSDVPKGDWVALIEEDGKLQLAISFGHAATEIGCKEGDTLYIESRTKTN